MIRPSWSLLPALLLLGCGSGSSSPTNGSGTNPTSNASGGKLTKLGVDDVKVGSGPGAAVGDSLTMRYRGTLADGSVFDSNDKAGDKPFTFVLGAGTVIKGWDQGLVGMKKGGERKLSIPASLGYGSRAMSKIPANSDLYFTVMLDDMVRKEDMDTVVVSDVKVGTGPSVKKGDTIVIDYVCTLTDGTKVDSTLDSKKPYRFKVGAGDVWQGIDAGVVGMKLGGERKLQIPFELGPKLPGIPPGSVTHYDVFLREIKH